MEERLLKEKVPKNLSKTIYKTLILILKVLPFIIAFCYLGYTVFLAFGIDLFFIGYISHTSLLSWLFIYLSSFAFKFCIKHRIPMYYIATNDTLQFIDTYYKIPLDTNSWTFLSLVVALLFIILYLYLKFRK